LERQHDRERKGACDGARSSGRLTQRLRHELAGDHRDHRSCGESERRRQQLREGVDEEEGGNRQPRGHTSGRMAAMNPRSTDRPSRRTVAISFGIAIGTALVLVVAELLLRNGDSTPVATATPRVDLRGIPQSGSVLGSPSAAVTLIEYADPQCPACRLYTESIVPTVVDEYVRSGKVATEFRGFPFIGSDSVTGYRSLLAAGRQDKLWNLAEALYRNQGDENSGWLTEDLVRQLAAEIPDLDVDRLLSNAQRPDIVGQASRAAAKASAAGIRGTPTFLVKRGDSTPYLIEVASVDDMRAALDHALSG
jgi:protein-disulfide isomerase